MCWIMEKINISIKCTGWNGRKEYQYKMCWVEWRKGILVQNVLDGMEDGNTSIKCAGQNRTLYFDHLQNMQFQPGDVTNVQK